MVLATKFLLFGAFFVSREINPCESFLNLFGSPLDNTVDDGTAEVPCNKSSDGSVTTVTAGNVGDGFDNTSLSRHHQSIGSGGGHPDGKIYCDIGKEQSPIDIIASGCKTKDYPHVSFLDDILFSNDVLYENNCETAKITLVNKTLKPMVHGGSLGNNSYVIDNIHFHWGSKDTVGCEHTVDGQHFPMEAHLVLYKSSEKDFDSALDNKNVAVLSFLFTLQNHTVNEKLRDIVHAVTEVLQPHTTFKASGSSLAFMKDYIGGGFYTYKGSLTTHTCTEGVLWIVFKKLVPIAHQQLLIFHDVIGDDGEELQNWRKTLPLHERSVWQSSY